MRRKVLATLCAAMMAVSAVSAAKPAAVKAAEPLASYDFEDGFGEMTPGALGGNAAPTIVADEVKGNVVQLEFGEGPDKAESYVTFANPYAGKELSAVTFMAWVKVPDTENGNSFHEYDNLIAFKNDAGARLTLQTMPYLCWNAGADDNWIDEKASAAFNGNVGKWLHYAVVITDEAHTVFVNGEQVEFAVEVNAGGGYDAATVLPFLASDNAQAYLGYGSFWGSQTACLDDVAFYDMALNADEIKAAANIDAVLAAQQAQGEGTEEPSEGAQDSEEGVEEPPENAQAPEEGNEKLKAPEKVDLSTVTAAVPEDYAAYYAFDGNLTDAVSGQAGHTTGRLYNEPAGDENATYEAGMNGQAVSFLGFGDGVSLPVAPSSSQYTISVDLFVKKAGSYTPAVFLANLSEDGTVKGTDEDAQWISLAVLGWHENIADGPMVWSRNVPEEAPWNDLHAPGNGSIEENKWFNMTVVADGATGTIYVDGSPIATGPIADIIDGTTAMYLGVNAWDAVFNGLVDNLYVYNRALSAEEVAGLAKASLTPDPIDIDSVEPAVAEGYASYYSFDGNLTDAVTGQTGHTTGRLYNEPAGDENATYETGISGQAVSFLGFGDGVSLPTAPKGSQYTVSIDLFVKKASSYTPAVFLANLNEDGTVKGTDEDAQWISMAVLGWHENVSDGPMVWSRNVPGGAAWNDLHMPENGKIAENKWFNMTVVADGATGTIYVDGVAIATGPIADIIDGTTSLYLGVNAWDAVFNGLMDNLYIYDRCLTDLEVAALAKASLTESTAPEPTEAPEATPTEVPAEEDTEATPVPTDAAPTEAAPASTDSGSGSNTGLIVGIIVAVAVVVGGGAAVVLKKKGASK